MSSERHQDFEVEARVVRPDGLPEVIFEGRCIGDGPGVGAVLAFVQTALAADVDEVVIRRVPVGKEHSLKTPPDFAQACSGAFLRQSRRNDLGRSRKKA
ncbi:MAG: hypothetical protein KKB70_08585 [Proteobacteria bacterium]|nr:hypothetical protein [Pseudomonadota bacterium]